MEGSSLALAYFFLICGCSSSTFRSNFEKIVVQVSFFNAVQLFLKFSLEFLFKILFYSPKLTKVGPVFWNVVFETVNIISWKSQRLVSKVVVCWKLLNLFVKTISMHHGSPDLKQVLKNSVLKLLIS